jgi:1,2-dihydroxy-3-keto-5-methylthiopentene dioxygenase
MSRLRIFTEADPANPVETFDVHELIAEKLGEQGIRFERWEAAEPIVPGDPPEKVIAAYARDIERLRTEEGYQAVDVISLSADHPDKEALRKKFLDEHTHSEDEVRFFVAGSGLFTLHLGTRIYEVLCTAGDLIGVPDGTPHWFDMGPQPHFVAIRLFTNQAGWVANFTGSDIAQNYPRYE